MKVTLSGYIEMDNLFKCMNACVSSPCALHGNWMISNFCQGVFKYSLDATLIDLPLPS
jgi:hypothetical protein